MLFSHILNCKLLLFQFTISMKDLILELVDFHLEFFILLAELLSCVCFPGLNCVALSFFVFDLRLQLVHYFFVLDDGSIFFWNVWVKLFLKIMGFTLQLFILSLVSVCFILRSHNSFLQFFSLFVEFSFSGVKLTLLLLLLSSDFYLSLTLCLLDLSKELFFFQCNSLSFKFDRFKLFSVLSSKFTVLGLSLLELLSLQLVLFIDCHNWFEISLHPL